MEWSGWGLGEVQDQSCRVGVSRRGVLLVWERLSSSSSPSHHHHHLPQHPPAPCRQGFDSSRPTSCAKGTGGWRYLGVPSGGPANWDQDAHGRKKPKMGWVGGHKGV